MAAPERKLPRAILGHGDYDSDFSDDETVEKSCQQKNSEDAILKKPFQKEKQDKVAHRQVAMDEWDREEARNRRFHLIAMDAYARHKKFVNDYILYYGGKKEDFRRSGENDKTDLDVIRENHRFLWREEDEVDMSWEKRLSKKYYDKLFKEYCIADLRNYKENKFGFRWRHEQEVVSGKGALENRLTNSSLWQPLRYWNTAVMSSLVLLFIKLDIPNSSNHSLYLRDRLLLPNTSHRPVRSHREGLLRVPSARQCHLATPRGRAFSVGAPALWNELPPGLRQLPDLRTFRRELKTHLFICAGLD
ncbi:protein FRA10AC1 isoform X2 [Ahaetulla prasina]|uniref:protein FRA10AC1 isoform X2 n=1 Tax=Ahaetulla prasina TaxID=499056 RepID=UPI0026497CB1|nr:protein FRA10AC1 isoform X2 [Ahaetulla prasina]